MNVPTSVLLGLLCLMAGCGASAPPSHDPPTGANALQDNRAGSPEPTTLLAKSDGPSAEADPQLRALDRLVGRWRIAHEAEGEVEYRWMDGGHFLIQRVDFKRPRGRIKGVEIIGYLRPFGKDRSPDIMSRWYDDEGNTFDYVYAMQGDTLNIWGGERGSGAHYVGRFSPDGNTLTGKWTYPNGSGYATTATRIQ